MSSAISVTSIAPAPLVQKLRQVPVSGERHAAVSAAAGGAPAVEALVAAAVADHDRAAFGAAGGVRLGGEGDFRAAEVQGDRAETRRGRLLGAVAVGVPVH